MYYSFIDKTGEPAEDVRYISSCPKRACMKIFNRILREADDNEVSVNLTIINLDTKKKYYYKCLALKYDEPKKKLIAPHKYIYSRYDINILKLNAKMFEN